MGYAKFGGQTECIMGNSKIENLKYFEQALLGDGGWICYNLYTY